MQLEKFVAAYEGPLRAEDADPEGGVPPLLALLSSIGSEPQPGATILDLGCGVGKGVAALMDRGFDAFGVDLFELWGADASLYWGRTNAPRSVTRLRVAQTEPYRLPYPDASFDHVVSAVVLEHVDDRPAVFAELCRVLKPGGTSAHIFPSRWVPIVEQHIGVPFPAFCKNRTYLKLAALAGIRTTGCEGMNWREVYRRNVAQMRITHYPTRRQIAREAAAAGLEARFAQGDYIARSGTGWTRLHDRLATFRLGVAVRLAGRMVLNHMLVLRRP